MYRLYGGGGHCLWAIMFTFKLDLIGGAIFEHLNHRSQRAFWYGSIPRGEIREQSYEAVLRK